MMKPKMAIALLLIVVVLTGIVLLGRGRSRSPVTVTLRIAVHPIAQAGWVTREANSLRFKYLMGKQAGVKPFLAQRLSVQPLPDSPLLEARVGVSTLAQAKLYADAFVPTLQTLCSTQAQVALSQQSVH